MIIMITDYYCNNQLSGAHHPPDRTTLPQGLAKDIILTMINDYWSIITLTTITIYHYYNHNHAPDRTTLPKGLAQDGRQCVQSRFSTNQRLEQNLEGLRRRVP